MAELIDRLEAEMRESGPIALEEMRPSLRGYDPVVSGLHMLTNQIVSLRMEQGNSKVKHLPGPRFPIEIVEERLRRLGSAKRNKAIEVAQSKPKWKQQGVRGA